MDNTLANRFVDQLTLYQAANKDNVSIKRDFQVRKHEYNVIIETIKAKGKGDALQHELILGRRGSGKSTLLKRIEIEIQEDQNLNKKYIAINHAEEQAGIYTLADLWIKTLETLAFVLMKDINYKKFSDFNNRDEFARHLFDVIHNVCTQEDKQLILLLDNFDRIAENFTDDGRLLRELLINYNDIQLICGSTRMDEHFWKYDQPFYEFFRRHRLEKLSLEEINNLINHWAYTLDIPSLKNFVNNNKGKVENIRLLTDGLPRTLQFFIHILLHNQEEHGYQYLQKVMDSVSPLYQERLSNLPPQLRKVVYEMAFVWEACSAKQLVNLCNMESKLISTSLLKLAEYGIVEKIETNTKNHLYRISERFFNMWIIITQGDPSQKQKAKWMSIFLENWYEEAELKNMAKSHLKKLKSDACKFDEVLLLSKAYSQIKYITTDERDEIIDLTNKLGKDLLLDLIIRLPETFDSIKSKIVKLLRDKDYDKALELTYEIENEADGAKFFIIAVILIIQKNFIKAKQYVKLVEDKNNEFALFLFSIYYLGQIELIKAGKYFNKFYEKVEDALEKMPNHKMSNLLTILIDFDFFQLFTLINYIYNINKRQALKFSYKLKSNSNENLKLKLIIEIWNGLFDNVEARALEIVKEQEDAADFIHDLLVQYQKALVLKLFRNEEVGNLLKEKYAVLYYVTLILNNETQDNLLLKIPPEIQSTIDNVLDNIAEKQAFYRRGEEG